MAARHFVNKAAHGMIAVLMRSVTFCAMRVICMQWLPVRLVGRLRYNSRYLEVQGCDTWMTNYILGRQSLSYFT